MFSTANALPPLSAWTSDRPSQPVPSPFAQPLPTGACRFVLLHPSIHNQRCSCQCFHANGKPGSVCECGHQACYHTHTLPIDNLPPILPGRSTLSGLDPTLIVLVERIQRLEQALTDEKRAHEESLQRERQLRDGQYQNVQQALRQGVKKEQEIREKLIELEDRIEGNYDEQVRTVERLIAVDDATMLLEKRLDDLDDGPKSKRRRLVSPHRKRIRTTRSEPRSFGDESSFENPLQRKSEVINIGKETLARTDDRPRPEHNEIGNDTLYPRSSGILDTSKMPKSLPLHPPSPYGIDSPPPSPRSSGVLDVSMLPPLSQPEPESPEGSSKGGHASGGAISSPSPSPLFYNSLAPMFELDQQHQASDIRNIATAIKTMTNHQRPLDKMMKRKVTLASISSSPSTTSKSTQQLTTPPDDDTPLEAISTVSSPAYRSGSSS